MHHLRGSALAVALLLLLAAPAVAQTSPSSGQLNLPPGTPPAPEAVPYAPPKPGSPVVQTLVGRDGEGPLVVRKRAGRIAFHPHHYARRHYARHVPLDLERPALAGVTLLRPLPPAPQPPHIAVPMPEYPLDTIAAAFTTPPPQIVCHPTRRIRDLPDPELYRERTLECEPDNP